jgi:hypothetical protein
MGDLSDTDAVLRGLDLERTVGEDGPEGAL